MKQIVIALAAGLLFGAGLAVSGMADPQRVQAFLDLFGAWDPTLAFVMGGAMIPMAIAWVVQRRMRAPFAAQKFDLPGTSGIARTLALGALIFGQVLSFGILIFPRFSIFAVSALMAVILIVRPWGLLGRPLK